MKKTKLLLFSCLLMATGLVFAQTTVPDGGDLGAAIEAAADGDVLELVSGGVYMSSSDIVLDKSITIKAADDAAVRPLIVFSTTYFIKGAGNAETKGQRYTFQGFEVIGTKSSNYFSRFYKGDSLEYIEFTDVYATSIYRSLVRASEGKEQSIDTVIIDNCHLYDFAEGQDYAALYLKKGCDVKYVSVTNSTFDGFGKEFIEAKNQNGTIEVIVDHVNAHRTTDKKNEPIFDIDGDVGSSFILSNSIISNIQQVKWWAISGDVADTVLNSYYWDAENDSAAMSNVWSLDGGWSKTDPMFSHDSVGAYFLTAGSPALTAATDGGAIGDPRWAVTADPAGLINLEIDAIKYLTPAFDPDVLSYSAEFLWEWDTVQIFASANFADATITGDEIVSMVAGDVTRDIVVTGTDASTKTYTLAMKRIPRSTDADLTNILVRNETDTFDLTPVFDAATMDYMLNLPSGTADTLIVETSKSDGSASVTGDGGFDIVDDALTVTIYVTAEDPAVVNTYTIAVKICGASTDASLQTLTIDGSEVEGFAPGTMSYDVMLAEGITTVPTVDALPTDLDAEFVITQAADVNGTATVVITAPDCVTMETYEINFSEYVGIEMNPEKNMYMYHNSEMNQLSIFNAGDVKLVNVYSITGKLVISRTIDSNESLEIDTDNLSNGVYMVRMRNANNEIQTGKFIK